MVGYGTENVESEVVYVVVVVRVVVIVIDSVVGRGDMIDNSASARALIVGDVVGVNAVDESVREHVVVSVGVNDVEVVVVESDVAMKSRRSSESSLVVSSCDMAECVCWVVE